MESLSHIIYNPQASSQEWQSIYPITVEIEGAQQHISESVLYERVQHRTSRVVFSSLQLGCIMKQVFEDFLKKENGECLKFYVLSIPNKLHVLPSKLESSSAPSKTQSLCTLLPYQVLLLTRKFNYLIIIPLCTASHVTLQSRAISNVHTHGKRKRPVPICNTSCLRYHTPHEAV